jgi:uncharacterized protein with HEPN domain
MTRPRLIVYLEEMTRACDEIGQFIAGMSKDGFLQDVLTQRAVGMNLLIIGEAATQLADVYPDFAADHPEMAWVEMRGMRNRIAHGYLSINLDTVWMTATKAVPDLLFQLRMLRQIHAQGE